MHVPKCVSDISTQQWLDTAPSLSSTSGSRCIMQHNLCALQSHHITSCRCERWLLFKDCSGRGVTLHQICLLICTIAKTYSTAKPQLNLANSSLVNSKTSLVGINYFRFPKKKNVCISKWRKKLFLSFWMRTFLQLKIDFSKLTTQQFEMTQL